ncbi:hypothetical protein ACA081_01145 [Candidatus Hodgkinia cicadicola]
MKDQLKCNVLLMVLFKPLLKLVPQMGLLIEKWIEKWLCSLSDSVLALNRLLFFLYVVWLVFIIIDRT